MDEITEKLSSSNLSPDFENGLAGIGWGIDYLVRNGFIEADIDGIFVEIDDRVYQHVMFSEDMSINNVSLQPNLDRWV